MWLTIRSGQSAGKTIEITGPVLIGRSEVCQVLLDDPRAGRRHAHLRPAAGGAFILQDLGSGSGTYVNGQPADGEVLLRGDETLRIGDTMIALSLSQPPAGGHDPAVAAPIDPAAVAWADRVAPTAIAQPDQVGRAEPTAPLAPPTFPPPPAAVVPPSVGPSMGAPAGSAALPDSRRVQPWTGGPTPPPGGPPTAGRGRRIPILIASAAALVVVILVLVLVVFRSGPSDPQVVGLKARAAGPIEVDLSWSTDGPTATSYSVLRNNARLRSVAGSARSFKDTSADPSTTYTYRVDAVDQAGKRHPSSVSVVTTPGPPPLSAARVQGGWKVTVTYVKENFVGVKKGDTFKVTFTFTAPCPAGACDVRLKPYFSGQKAMTAALQNGTYTARAGDTFTASCGRITQTDVLRFHAATAAFTDRVFLATRLEGTLDITSPRGGGCSAASGHATLVATPS